MKVLITGISGFVGSMIVKKILNSDSLQEKVTEIIGVDIREPNWIKDYNIKFYKASITDDSMESIFKEHQVESVIHLASMMAPTSKLSRKQEYDIDVGGTENVCQMAIKHGVKQFITASSGAAYGYYADNPEWIKETDALRGNYEMPYAYHKKLIDELLQDTQKKHPDFKVLTFRIGTILGDTISNQITDLYKKPILFGVRGGDSRFVYIYDEDVADAFIHGLVNEKKGIFNLIGDGALDLEEQAQLLGKKSVRIPYSFLKWGIGSLRALKLTQYNVEKINFVRYRPVLLNKSLKEDFGFTPKHTSKQAFVRFREQNLKQRM